MKFGDFIRLIFSVEGNLPLVVIDHSCNARFLDWGYTSDENKARFSLVLREAPAPKLDKAGLELLLAHFLGPMPEDSYEFEDYEVRIAWQASRLGENKECPYKTIWGSAFIEDIGIAGVTLPVTHEHQRMLAFQVPKLPEYEEVKAWS